MHERSMLGLVPIAVMLACGDDATSGTTSGGNGAGGMGGETSNTGAGGAETSTGGSGGEGAGGGPPTEHRVFVTSGTFNGALGSLAAGDALCQAAAEDADLGGTWLAWLSESPFGKDPMLDSPVTRFTQSAVPYVLVGGGQIAPDWAGLIDGSLDAPIDRDETGALIGDVIAMAWTGTTHLGEGMSPCCGNWTDVNTGSAVGLTTAVDQTWSFNGGMSCATLARLFCFQQ